jgi:hypothetical protein
MLGGCHVARAMFAVAVVCEQVLLPKAYGKHLECDVYHRPHLHSQDYCTDAT